uniref:Uncharacterized protein n=1 Tax=Oryza punctata TaxID=4537 RepID=A0A0E0MHS8_ORYPU
MDAQGALDSLLGRLGAVLLSEAQLLGGVRGDVETGCNVVLYIHYVGGATSSSGSGGRRILGYLRRTARFARTIVVRHRVATRIRELKVSARDVGDRRHRYGVNVPHAPPAYRQNGGCGNADDRPALRPGGPEEEEDLRRRELLHGEPPAMADTVIRWLLDGELPSRDRSSKVS